MLELVLLTAFPLAMTFAASSDLLTMTIPNALAIGLVAAFLPVAFLAGLSPETVGLHLAAGAVVLVGAFCCFARGWMGGGDAKLASASAVWLGFGVLPEYLLLSALAGGALTLSLLGLRHVPLPVFASRWPWADRLHQRETGIPYGIALAAAALVAYPHSPVWLAIASR